MYSMTAIAAYNRESMSVSVLLDNITNLSILLTGFNNIDSFAETFMCHLHQILMLIADVAHEESLVQIAMESAMIYGYIDVA